MHYLVFVFLSDEPRDRQQVEVKVDEELADHGAGRHWDWYAIGGRWTGHLDGYDPTQDEANWEICNLCGGTGTRTLPVPGIADWRTAPGTCNGCDQWKGGLPLGMRVRWGFAPHDGDCQPTSRIGVHGPYAVVSPGWGWVSKELWTGLNLIPNPDFEAIYAKCRERYNWVVVVDCHN